MNNENKQKPPSLCASHSTESTRKIPKLLACIGAQKSGTTWLHSVMADTGHFHSGFFKEIHYFDSIYNNSWFMNRRRAQQLKWVVENANIASITRWLNNQEPEDENQLKLFRNLKWCTRHADDDWYVDMMTPSDKATWSLDFSPGYATIGVEGYKHLDRLVDELKILFILRNPIDRSWSSLIHEARFSVANPVDPEKLLEKSDDELVDKLNRGNIPRYSNYLKTLRGLHDAGLLERTEVILYEDFRDNTRQAFNRVLRSIGVENDVHVSDETLLQRVFQSPKVPIPESVRARLRDQYGLAIKQIQQEFGFNLSGWQDFNLVAA